MHVSFAYIIILSYYVWRNHEGGMSNICSHDDYQSFKIQKRHEEYCLQEAVRVDQLKHS